ncbi:PepSY-associated TM helix domain-containing protein [Flavobacterium chungangense]|uniref:Peptidase n=1 Tax=Flavobacterium chungangense TaxID=554283 RepID=A0A6V6YWM1_9FLAO|nr:PepSY-associated TM helix domain-containing protein [Flavobacterium chungangense]CAD0003689.1 peptidase [Flavobacterium chungangense]
MNLKKAIRQIHLWLGLATGLVVFIICLTAAIWAFSPEIESATQPYRHVTKQDKPFLSVSGIQKIAQKELPKKKVNRVSFEGRDKAATADFYGDDYYYTVFINPYNGKILAFINNENGFFRWIIKGHYELWMGEIGGEIVHWSTLIFVLMLITGIVLWWPKNKAARKQRFKVKMGTSPKRLNYDLHNVLGFYASWIVIFAALTGVIWTFECVSEAEYWLASGGEEAIEYPNPIAKNTKKENLKPNGIDSVFTAKLKKYNNPHSVSVGFPQTDSTAYNVSIYPNETGYDSDDFYYNQYTLEEIPVKAYGKYANANTGEIASRMNYDIHIGSIFGLTGRIAMFLAVLIGASLPITGFYIWWGRNNKKKQK